jgi:hypothetical protein
MSEAGHALVPFPVKLHQEWLAENDLATQSRRLWVIQVEASREWMLQSLAQEVHHSIWQMVAMIELGLL